MHELDKLVVLLKAAGVSGVMERKDILPEWEVCVSGANGANIVNALRDSHPKAIIITLCAGCRFRQKQWGLANYAETIRLLAKFFPKIIVIIIGSDSERSLLGQILSMLSSAENVHCVNMAGGLSILESIEVIRNSDLCVGNDTFGLHAAIAVGTQSVVVMWSGDPDAWIPWGDPRRHRMIRAEVPCAGCYGECMQKDVYCLQKIKPSQLAAEIANMLWDSSLLNKMQKV